MKKVILQYDDGIEVLVDIDDETYERLMSEIGEIEKTASATERDASLYPRIDFKGIKLGDILKSKLDKYIDLIKVVGEKATKELKPDSISLSVGFAISGKTNIVLVQGEAKANITLTLNWENGKEIQNNSKSSNN